MFRGSSCDMNPQSLVQRTVSPGLCFPEPLSWWVLLAGSLPIGRSLAGAGRPSRQPSCRQGRLGLRKLLSHRVLEPSISEVV